MNIALRPMAMEIAGGKQRNALLQRGANSGNAFGWVGEAIHAHAAQAQLRSLSAG